MIHNLTSMVRIGTAFYYSLKVSRCLMLFLIQEKRKTYGTEMMVRCVVVCVCFADSLLLTESVVEDAYKHLNGTARPFTDGR